MKTVICSNGIERTGDPTVGLLEPRIHYHNGRIMVVDLCNQEFPIIFPTLEVYGQSTIVFTNQFILRVTAAGGIAL